MLINEQLLTACLLGSLLISTIPAFSQENDVCADISLEQVSQFALDHQDGWAGRILMVEFFDGQDISGMEVTFKTPFPAYTVSPENAFDHTTGQPDFISLLKFQGRWFAPAFLGDKPVAWLKISCNNSLSITGFGSSILAEELDTLNQKLVNLEVEQSWFVQVFSTKHIFLVVKRHENYTIYPLRAFPSSYAGLETIDELGGYNPIEVFAKIKEQWPIPEDCTVIYRSDGTLHIPCVTVEGSSLVRYSAILEIIDQKTLTFGVFELKDNPNMDGN